MGNYHQLSGSPHWVLLPNLAPDCKTPFGARTADAEEVFTRDAELMPFAGQRASSVHQGWGVCLLFGQWPHLHLKCSFLPNSSTNEPRGSQQMCPVPQTRSGFRSIRGGRVCDFRRMGASLQTRRLAL